MAFCNDSNEPQQFGSSNNTSYLSLAVIDWNLGQETDYPDWGYVVRATNNVIRYILNK
jgi:hypothetical protein